MKASIRAAIQSAPGSRPEYRPPPRPRIVSPATIAMNKHRMYWPDWYFELGPSLPRVSPLTALLDPPGNGNRRTKKRDISQ
jgi:hypothetical protein